MSDQYEDHIDRIPPEMGFQVNTEQIGECVLANPKVSYQDNVMVLVRYETPQGVPFRVAVARNVTLKVRFHTHLIVVQFPGDEVPRSSAVTLERKEAVRILAKWGVDVEAAQRIIEAAYDQLKEME